MLQTDLELCRYSASLRDEVAWSVQNRSSLEELSFTKIGGPSGIPLLILDEVMDVLKEELRGETFKLNWRGAGIMKLRSLEPPGSDTFNNGYNPIISRTLASCTLVHSSWTMRARRARGSVLVMLNRINRLPRIVCSPCFGVWTREVSISFNLHVNSFSAYSSLFARLPNVEFLHVSVDFYEDEEIQSSAPELCRAISEYLRNVKELVFKVLWPARARVLVRHLWDFPKEMPVLQTVHLVGVNTREISSCERSVLFSLPATIPRLRSVHVHQEYEGTYNFFDITHVGWSRSLQSDNDEASDVASNSPAGAFAADCFSCTALGKTNDISDEERRLISEVKQMKISLGKGCGSSGIENITCGARSLKKLHLVMFDNVDETWLTITRGLRALPSTVSEILVTFVPRGLDSGKVEVELWDVRTYCLLSALYEHSERLIWFETEDYLWSPMTKRWCDGYQIGFTYIPSEVSKQHRCWIRLHFK